MNVTTRAAARQATTAYLSYDDRFLYVGFKVQQKSALVATQTTNDVGLGLDDFVGIGVDTSGAGSQAYYFETTPRGVRYEQASDNVRYRARWQSVARTTPDGWSAVMIVPLSVLRVRHAGLQTWRVQFVRNVAADAEHYAWAWNGLMMDGTGASWPIFQDARFWAAAELNLAASAAARARPRADAYALASLGENRDLFQQANQAFLPTKVRSIGIDVSYPISSTINFVGTLNPDFSNVEIDQQTVVPQEFEKPLVEYRPFFAQGAPFINATSGNRSPVAAYAAYPDTAFYSPSIGPFDSGAQVEGSFGNQSFGLLTFHGWNQTTGDAFDDEAYGYQHALQNGTFSYWSDGVIARHSVAGNDDTVEAGAQGRNLASGFEWFVDYSSESGSFVPQRHADLSELFLEERKPNYLFNIGYLNVAPNYNPIDGYTANSDIRGPQGELVFIGSTSGVKNYVLALNTDRFIDGSGAVHQADADISLTATFKNAFSLDGVGSTVGELRSYAIPSGPECTGPIVTTSSFTGSPCYLDGVTSPYDLILIPIGYRDGTPAPFDASYSWGSYGPNYIHLMSFSTSRPLTKRISLGLEYDGTDERAFATGKLDSQWLRRVSLGVNLSTESTFSIALRDINGLGGFATAVGNNLAIAFHQRFKTGNELFVNYGTPAASATLNRLIVKYVFHAGPDAGT